PHFIILIIRGAWEYSNKIASEIPVVPLAKEEISLCYEGVMAGTAPEIVDRSIRSSIQKVAAKPAIKRIRAAASMKLVIAGLTVQDIVTAVAPDDVIELAALDVFDAGSAAQKQAKIDSIHRLPTGTRQINRYASVVVTEIQRIGVAPRSFNDSVHS